LDKTSLQEQQIEAELIAARLFRYKVRRGLGVFYALIAAMPILGIILYLTVTPLFVVSGLVAGYVTIYECNIVWIFSREGEVRSTMKRVTAGYLGQRVLLLSFF
jgi:hypothetical protein